MKFTRLNRNAPVAILDWIESELENRGIDAVVYTKYILSLLQDEDDDNGDPKENVNNFASKKLCEYHSKIKNRSALKENNKPSGKRRHKRYANINNSNILPDEKESDCCHCFNVDGKPFNENKKLAVIEVLRSATEQEVGIESFVEELCMKLRNIKMNLSSESDNEDEMEYSKEQKEVNCTVSPLEQAQKYYAAFPALGSLKEENTPKDIIMTEMKKKYENNKDWDGRRIVKHKERNDDSSTQQTATTAPRFKFKNFITNSDNNNSKDKFLSKNSNQTEMNGILSIESCNEMELVNLDFEHINPTFNNKSDDNETFQKLVDKFNSNIASIWTNCNTESNYTDVKSNHNNVKSNCRDVNIWRFDSAFSSPQYSESPSPKLRKNNNQAEYFNSNLFIDTLSNLSTNSENIWDSFKINDSLLDFGIIQEKQAISLSNHRKDSLFVELIPKYQTSSECTTSNQMSSNKTMDSSFENQGESVENLLFSPKTHFQPIKQDSLEREYSDDGSLIEADAEVASLTICSSKCPNVKTNSRILNHQNEARPVSTSFEELTSFMGPFNEDIIFDERSFLENKQFYLKNTGFEEKNTLNESESEPEYQDLCKMLNEFLKDGINEDSNVHYDTSEKYLDLCDDDEKEVNNFNLKEMNNFNLKEVNNFNLKEMNFNSKAHQRFTWGNFMETYNNDKSQNVIHENSFNEDEIYDNLFNCGDYSSEDQSLYNTNLDQNYFMNDSQDNYINDFSHVNQLSSHFWNDNLEFQKESENLLKPQMNAKSCEVNQKYEKPCTYFLEGNCKRSVCKFSHDLSRITCKFWQEGFCFKEEACPFLHGYISDEYYGKNTNYKQDPSFTIESEADFPTLSLNESYKEFEVETTTVNSKQMPLAVFVKKKGKKRKDRNLQ